MHFSMAEMSPSSAKEYLEDLEAEMEKIGVGQVATISGRYYAMDRDKRWDRVEKAYLALTEGTGRLAPSSSAAIDYAYDHGETDEFVIPTVIVDGSQQPRAKIGCKDAVIFFNFRADRARELTWAFINDDFNGFERPSGKLDLCFVTMAQYDAKLKVPFAYPPQNLGNTLGNTFRNCVYSSCALQRRKNTPMSPISSTAVLKNLTPAKTGN